MMAGSLIDDRYARSIRPIGQSMYPLIRCPGTILEDRAHRHLRREVRLCAELVLRGGLKVMLSVGVEVGKPALQVLATLRY